MRSLLRKNAIFFIPYIIILAFSLCLLLFFDKASIHLFINRFHSSSFDFFFTYFTHLADGLLILFIGIIFFAFNKERSLFILVSFGISSAITQILKKVIYHEQLRPSVFFNDLSNLYIVPGVDIHGYFSFPSGHTAGAFCLATCLVLSGSNTKLQLFLLLYALLAAYSRMYLSQHFLVDVVVGSTIGVCSALVVYPIFYHWMFLKKIFPNKKNAGK
ncbi:MAG: phosphatase PAP2 family protein [Flavobacteriales bacterium]|nr:phosphatase PAP2 family protein [Flavobacteriales bacterium]